jgi:hypothetical protein
MPAIQISDLIQALFLSVIIFTGFVQIWHLIFLSILPGGAALFAKKLPVIKPIVHPVYKRLGIVHEIT